MTVPFRIRTTKSFFLVRELIEGDYVTVTMNTGVNTLAYLATCNLRSDYLNTDQL